MEELPCWRVVMRRKGKEARWARFADENPALLEEVRAEIERRGPLCNRDFVGEKRVISYRACKDSGLALYYLWLTGERMTHSRRNFERQNTLYFWLLCNSAQPKIMFRLEEEHFKWPRSPKGSVLPEQVMKL